MKDEFNISTCRILKSYSNDFKCDKNVNGMSDLKVELFNETKFIVSLLSHLFELRIKRVLTSKYTSCFINSLSFNKN